MSIAGITELKSILGIPAAVTFHDTALGLALDYANNYVLAQLGQTSFAGNTFTDYPQVGAPGIEDVQLRHVPIINIIGVTNGLAAVAAADFRVVNETGKVRLTSQTPDRRVRREFWSTDRDGVVITYTAGYTSASPELPRLKRAAHLIAGASFTKGQHSGVVKERTGSHAIEFSLDAIPAEAQLILNDFVDAHQFGF